MKGPNVPDTCLTKASTFGMKVKSVGGDSGDDAGRFRAVVSVFNNIDSVGDVVLRGAFVKSIDSWERSGDMIPIIWGHLHDDPFANVGAVLKAYETAEGLEIEGQLDLTNPTGAQVHKLMKGRRLRDFSFAYRVKASAPGTRDGRPVTELHELDVIEVGPVTVGANSATRLIDVKSAPPRISPGELATWAGVVAAPRISPAGLVAWAERNNP
jgi:HK97 family phage prohead protease